MAGIRIDNSRGVIASNNIIFSDDEGIIVNESDDINLNGNIIKVSKGLSETEIIELKRIVSGFKGMSKSTKKSINEQLDRLNGKELAETKRGLRRIFAILSSLSQNVLANLIANAVSKMLC